MHHIYRCDAESQGFHMHIYIYTFTTRHRYIQRTTAPTTSAEDRSDLFSGRPLSTRISGIRVTNGQPMSVCTNALPERDGSKRSAAAAAGGGGRRRGCGFNKPIGLHPVTRSELKTLNPSVCIADFKKITFFEQGTKKKLKVKKKRMSLVL